MLFEIKNSNFFHTGRATQFSLKTLVITCLFVFLLILLFSSIHTIYAAQTPPFLVIIDPGHGGKDNGTTFKVKNTVLTEKEINLEISKKIANELQKYNIRAILTRRIDKDLSLSERTGIANKLKADVFLSIHLNSTPASSQSRAEGIETYIIHSESNETSKRLAELQETVMAGNDLYPKKKEVALILRDLKLDANLSGSKHIACSIQGNLVKATGQNASLKELRNRGVRQSLFHVLLGAEMPGVLVEVGFLNSARDRNILLSNSGQDKIATGIAQAIRHYRHTNGTKKARLMLSKCQIH